MRLKVLAQAKVAFIQLKGYGDLLVLVNFLKNIDLADKKIVVTSKNYELLEHLKLSDSSIVVKFGGTTPAFYNLRKISRFLINDILLVRKTVKHLNEQGFKCVVDFRSWRNALMFFGLSVDYLPSSDNIYDSYSTLFDMNLHYEPSKVSKTIGIFPFGSTNDRYIPTYILQRMVENLNSKGYSVKILAHASHSKLIKNCSQIKIFDDFNSFDSAFKEIDSLITVDSMALHWAYGSNKPVYVLSNSWTYFIPRSILKCCFFKIEDYQSLLLKFK